MMLKYYMIQLVIKQLNMIKQLQELRDISIDSGNTCKMIRGYYFAKYIEDVHNEHLKIIKEDKDLINSKLENK